MEAAKAISEIKKQISIPLVADIHFDYRLAIEAVKKQTGKSFFFNVNDVDLNHRVNIDLKDAPLGKALSQILQGQDIDYEVKDNHIVLSKRKVDKI